MSVGTLLVCFRCEWTGPDRGRGVRRSCPRCRAPLHRQSPRAGPKPPESPTRDRPRPPDPIEAPAVEFVGAPPAPAPRPVRRRREFTAAAIALAAVGLAAVILGSRGGGGGGTPPPTGARSVAVPDQLRGLRAVVIPTVMDSGDPGAPLYRLWRIDPSEGRLEQGPVSGRVTDLRLDPTSPRERLAYLVDGGGLFVLEGFLGARPEWVAGGVSAFDFDPEGGLVYVTATEQVAPFGGGSRVSIEVIRLTNRLEESGDAAGFRSTLRGVDIDGVAVRGYRVFLWGRRGGRPVILEMDTRSPAGAPEVRPLPGEVISVSPDGDLLLGTRSVGRRREAQLLPAGERVPFALGPDVVVRRVLAWPEGAMAIEAAGMAGEPLEVFVVPIEPGALGEPVWLQGAIGSASVALVGDLALWAQPGSIEAQVLDRPAWFRIELPDGFAAPSGPLAVA